MSEPNLDAVHSPPMTLAVARLVWGSKPPALVSLLRALELTEGEGWGVDLLGVGRVEATWESLEHESTAHGYPAIEGGGTGWHDEVEDLNRLLKS